MISSTETSPLLLASEVAELLRVSERTVRQWAKNGLLPCIYIVKEIRFRKTDINQVLQKGLRAECTKNYTPMTSRKKKMELMPWEKRPAK